MLERLFYWLIDRMADFLGGLNPERKKKIEAIKAEGARLEALAIAAEAQRAESEAQYKKNADLRAEWDRLAAESERQAIESQARAVASQMREREIEDQNRKAKEAIDRMSPSERIRADL